MGYQDCRWQVHPHLVEEAPYEGTADPVRYHVDPGLVQDVSPFQTTDRHAGTGPCQQNVHGIYRVALRSLHELLHGVVQKGWGKEDNGGLKYYVQCHITTQF